jgi:ferredoxin
MNRRSAVVVNPTAAPKIRCCGMGACTAVAWWSFEYVDPAIDSLQIEARCSVNNPAGAIYQVEARAPQQMLLRGRIVLVLA